MPVMAARIQLLWWRGCPSWERALALLREEMTAHGLDEEELEVIEIEGEDDAERLGFPGSPTILIDGEDIQPPDLGQPTGLTCRVYRIRDGRVSPLPDPADLSDAFARMGR